MPGMHGSSVQLPLLALQRAAEAQCWSKSQPSRVALQTSRSAPSQRRSTAAQVAGKHTPWAGSHSVSDAQTLRLTQLELTALQPWSTLPTHCTAPLSQATSPLSSSL
jgi:hypothetical protein